MESVTAFTALLSPVLAVIEYPEISPEIFSFELFGITIALRWYSLAYITGLVFGWWYIRLLCARPGAPMSPTHMDDFLMWATLGVVVGGRLGSVLFYNLPYYIEHPTEIVFLWQGGMAFHGGALGVVIATILFCRRHKLELFKVADLVALVTPIGLLAGRVANFINGELWGRPTDVPWAMIFPRDPIQVPRHPSQLYEGLGEGVILFAILMVLYHKTDLRHDRPGTIAGVFFLGYAIARFLIEFVREPDSHIGLMGWISRGQMLTIPMVLLAAFLFWAGSRSSRGPTFR